MDRRRLNEVAAAHGATLVVQFGSTATGTSHVGSDVDLAVLLEQAPASYSKQSELAVAFQSFFPGQELDVVILNHADPLLLDQVTRHGVLLAGDEHRWQEFRVLAFKRYQDHRRFLRLERAYVDRAAAAARP